MAARRGIFLPPFDELARPQTLIDLARRAEAAGWDGFFLWDHVAYASNPEVEAIADVWICLAAIAAATERLRIGPMVTPLSRRRVQKVARETATLDALSGGRLTFGVGLGVERNGELEPFGEVTDARERAALLDGGLERLADFWDGEFEPRPVQSPRIPIWVAGRWRSRRRPLERASRWDGFFPIGLPDPDALRTIGEELAALRNSGVGDFDLIVEIDPGGDPQPWEESGATWVLTSFDPGTSAGDAAAVIDGGPAA